VRLQAAETLVSGATADIRHGIALSVDLAGDAAGLVGYRAKKHTGVVDVDAPGACAVADYWEPVRADSKRRLILDPDQFYILASKEAVHIPPTHAAEMMPFNPLVGEFRVHYAGFMDPGFGHSAAGGSGSRVVLEVRSHTVPFILEDGQIVGRLALSEASLSASRCFLVAALLVRALEGFGGHEDRPDDAGKLRLDLGAAERVHAVEQFNGQSPVAKRRTISRRTGSASA
jgi:deoxycytidine triphosphate deaminase